MNEPDGWSGHDEPMGDGLTDQPSTAYEADSGSVPFLVRGGQALAGEDGAAVIMDGGGDSRPAPGAWRRRPELPGLAAQGAAVTEPRRAVGAEAKLEAAGAGHAGSDRSGGPAGTENPSPLWPCAPGPREFPGRGILPVCGGKK